MNAEKNSPADKIVGSTDGLGVKTRCTIRWLECGDGQRVLQQFVLGFETEEWADNYLIKASGERSWRWVDIPTVDAQKAE